MKPKRLYWIVPLDFIEKKYCHVKENFPFYLEILRDKGKNIGNKKFVAIVKSQFGIPDLTHRATAWFSINVTSFSSISYYSKQ